MMGIRGTMARLTYLCPVQGGSKLLKMMTGAPILSVSLYGEVLLGFRCIFSGLLDFSVFVKHWCLIISSAHYPWLNGGPFSEQFPFLCSFSMACFHSINISLLCLFSLLKEGPSTLQSLCYGGMFKAWDFLNP